MAQLEVSVGADLSNLSKGMTDAAKIVSTESAKIDKSLLNIDNAAKRGGQSLQSFTKNSNQAGFALTNLGRVAQDAPFGFIGIQNNLNPLLESFQQLRQESGSNSAALKALGQSLVGPAGLGLALSLVSSAFVIYQQSQQRSKKSSEELAKANDDYVKSLNAVTRASLEGAQNAQKELTSLKSLFNAYQDANLPLSQRKNAYEEIQRLYPSYFGNLSFETTATDKTKDAYNRLSASIIATARARAAENLITQNSAKQLEIEQKLVDLQAQKRKNEIEAAKVIKSQGTFNPATGGGGGAAATLNLTKQQRDTDNEIIELAKQRNELRRVNLQLEKSVSAEIAKGADLTNDTAKGVKNIKDNLDKIEAIDILTLFKSEDSDFVKFNKEVVERLAKGTDFKIPETIVAVPLDFQLVNPEITSGFDLFLQTIQSQAETLNNTIVPFVSETFSNLGAAFASGDFSQLGKGLLNSLTGFLKSLGQLMIKEGAAYVVRGIAANIALPGSGVPFLTAGKLLIGGGAALSLGAGAISGSGQNNSNSGQGYQIPQFANGVTNFEGGLAMVGERGKELVTLPTGSNVITNENLRRYGNRNTQSSVIIPDVKIQGQDLVVVFNRANKNLNRVT